METLLPSTAISKVSARVMAACTALFSLRVAGQAIQRWHPVGALPEFGAWQGSALPYGPLLAAQIAIATWMTWLTVGAWHQLLAPTRKAMKWLAIGGGIYMACAIGRIAVGLGVPEAHPWFRAWISGAFHIVLATFVLALSTYHAAGTRALDRATLAEGLLPYVWYPLFIALALAAFFALLAFGASPVVALYVPAVVTGVAILLLEFRFAERDDWRPGKSDLIADTAFMALVQVALPKLLLAIVVIGAAGFAHRNIASGIWPHEWPLFAQMIAMVLAVDFMRYWLHRACHVYMPLWRLHEVHHSPDILYVVNVGRFHPLEKVLHFSLDTVPFLLLGVAPEVMAGYALLYSVNGFFQHSNLKLRYGWLNYVVGSAETHRWHHARDPKQAMCNFGNTTVIWDVVFGTWHLPGPVGDIGIADRSYPKGFLAQMAAPFRRTGDRAPRSPRRWLADTLVSTRLRVTGITARMRLARTARNPMCVQRELLARIVRDNRDTEFGREHGFDSIESYEDFARRVPVQDFEQLRPYIQSEIVAGEAALTSEVPVRYVRTSGTTGEPKDIPLTLEHLDALQRVHRDSVAFQYRACPEAFEGGIVAMVSPAFEGRLENGKPYGSASGIVAGNTPAAVREKFVVPTDVMAIPESRVKYLLALRLAIARRDVTYLGAANSTTLLTLIKLFREHRTELIEDLHQGTFFLLDRVPADVLEAVPLPRDPERAEELAGLCKQTDDVRIRDLWPSLRMVVTWTCASAGVAADALRKELAPDTRILELGYVSSEFRGTITIGRCAGMGLPTLDAHFYEFVERDSWDAGNPRYLTLDRLRKGGEYYVIVTTPSGLYRYFINDVVKVTGFLHATPLLRFQQKGKGVTNITGEKLYEAQVLQAVRESMQDKGRGTQFVMMLADEATCGYTLYVEPELGSPIATAEFARAVDTRLAKLNVEYQAKRESERLKPLEVRWLVSGAGERFKQHCVERGQREGQFKMVALDYRHKFTFDLDACTEAA